MLMLCSNNLRYTVGTVILYYAGLRIHGIGSGSSIFWILIRIPLLRMSHSCQKYEHSFLIVLKI
jgi:hypothetical protein